MDSIGDALGLLFTSKQLARDLQLPSLKNMWHKLARYKLDVWFRRPVVHESDNRGAQSRLITGEWAEYSAPLPEKTKWKAVAYLLSKIRCSLRRSREETASKQSE